LLDGVHQRQTTCSRTGGHHLHADRQARAPASIDAARLSSRSRGAARSVSLLRTRDGNDAGRQVQQL
jgi:hypothetical protein